MSSLSTFRFAVPFLTLLLIPNTAKALPIASPLQQTPEASGGATGTDGLQANTSPSITPSLEPLPLTGVLTWNDDPVEEEDDFIYDDGPWFEL